MGRPPLGHSLVVALFVTVAWASASFAIAGLLAVLLDRDPVQTPVAPWVGIVGLVLSGVGVWLATGLGIRARAPWLAAITAAASAYLTITVLAFFVSFALLVEQASSPFVIAAALLAAVAVVAAHRMVRRPPDTGLPQRDSRS